MDNFNDTSGHPVHEMQRNPASQSQYQGAGPTSKVPIPRLPRYEADANPAASEKNRVIKAVCALMYIFTFHPARLLIRHSAPIAANEVGLSQEKRHSRTLNELTPPRSEMYGRASAMQELRGKRHALYI